MVSRRDFDPAHLLSVTGVLQSAGREGLIP